MLNITFLGTGAAVPSRNKAMSCIAIKQNKSITLFDCAEGSQRQLMISPLSFMKIDSIFITHMHGDHVLGLPGLLQTMGMSGRKEPLGVYGPSGIKSGLETMLSVCEGEIGYDLTIQEVEPGEVIDLGYAKVSVFKTEHGMYSLGYVYREKDAPGTFNKAKALELGLTPGPEFSRLQAGEIVKGVYPDQVIGPAKKGMVVVYTGDTIPCQSIRDNSVDADVLIHECTYAAGEEELAKAHWHSTSVQAAEVARDCNVKCLMLTHVSNRYDDVIVVEEEAKEIFSNTYAVKDLEQFDVTPKGVKQV